MRKSHPKENYQIHQKGDKFTVSKKEYIFWIIPIWVEITVLETENSPEQIAEFKTLKEVEDFIDQIIS